MDPGPDSAHPSYRRDIDGLRAIAVISVVVFHAFPRVLGGGFVGVDVFFVISGFLISGIILNGIERGTFRFRDFYYRRVRRIFPALTIVLFTFLVLGWVVLLPDEFRQLGKHTAAGAGFVSNIAFWKEAGYFDTAGPRKPLLHLWSLSIEEQFYLGWPLCLVVLSKQTKRLLLWVVVLALASFALNVGLMDDPSTSFYMPFTRFWELLVGCIVTLRSGVESSALVRNAYSAAGTLLILAALLLLNGDRDFPGWWALLPSMGAALLILAGPEAWINRKILSARWLVLVGLISYPLYLWHWPLFSFARILDLATERVMLALIAVSVVLAWATWKYVESGVRQRRLRHDIAILTAGMGLAAALGAVLFATDGMAGRHDSAVSSTGMRDINANYNPVDCVIRAHIFNFCNQTRTGQPDALVVGDSHANMMISGLAAADPHRTWLVVGNDSCPPVLGVLADGANKPHCAERMRNAFDYVTSPDTPRLVVLAFFGSYAETSDVAADHLLDGFGPSNYRLESEPPLPSKHETLELGLRNAISLLLSRDKRVVLMIDVPELPFFPRDCIKRRYLKPANCHLDISSVMQRQTGIRAIAQELKRDFPQIGIFDPLPLICGDEGCDPIHDDLSYYMDSHHLSVRGSERVARGLVAMIDDSSDRATSAP